MPDQDPETAAPARGNPVRGIDAPPTVAPDQPEPAPSIEADGPPAPEGLGGTVTTDDTPETGVPAQAQGGLGAADAFGGADLEQAQPGAETVPAAASDDTARALPADHPEDAADVAPLIRKDIG